MSELYPFRDDCVSTAEIGRRLGFAVTSRFIATTLGVKPSLSTRAGYYWSPEELQKVYEAMIEHIKREATARI